MGPSDFHNGPRLDISAHPSWWPRPTTAMDLTRCLKDLPRMLTPLPRLERTGSSVGCSPAPQRPSPCGRRVGSSEKLSRPAQGSRVFSACAFAPRFHRGLPRRLQPDDCSCSAAPVATGRSDNSPDGTFTRGPSRPRRSLRNLRLSSRQASFRVALPPKSFCGTGNPPETGPDQEVSRSALSRFQSASPPGAL